MYLRETILNSLPIECNSFSHLQELRKNKVRQEKMKYGVTEFSKERKNLGKEDLFVTSTNENRHC